MTDRHIVEKKQNEMWEDSIKSAVKEMGGDESSVNLLKFYCGVHPLIQFAEVAEEVIKKYESNITEKSGSKSSFFLLRGESGTVHTIRDTTKLFFKDGPGDPLFASTFLEQNGVPNLPLVNFKHNRFNVLFKDAAGVYFLKDKILMYFNTCKEQINGMQASIVKDLQHPPFMHGCRALGLISELVTSPYMRKVESPKMTALGMNPYYQELVEKLETWGRDASPIIEGRECLFDADWDLCKGSYILKELVKPSTNDEAVKNLLQDIFKSMSEKAKSLFSDHLSGGIYFNVTEPMKEASESCKANNICLERLMAQLDRNLRSVQNANQDTRSSKLMFQNNKTSAWLKDKSENEIELITTQARQTKMSRKTIVRQRNLDIKKEIVAILKQREQTKKLKAERITAQRESLLAHLHNAGGLWSTPEQIKANLSSLTSKSQKLQALKSQISARKRILKQQVVDMSLFAFSKGGKQFSVEQLTTNLSLIVQSRVKESDEHSDIVEQIELNPRSVIGKHVKHCWTLEDGSDKWYYGKIIELMEDKNILNYQICYPETSENNSLDADDDENDDDLFEISVMEFINDFKNGTLDILD